MQSWPWPRAPTTVYAVVATMAVGANHSTDGTGALLLWQAQYVLHDVLQQPEVPSRVRRDATVI